MRSKILGPGFSHEEYIVRFIWLSTTFGSNYCLPSQLLDFFCSVTWFHGEIFFKGDMADVKDLKMQKTVRNKKLQARHQTLWSP